MNTLESLAPERWKEYKKIKLDSVKNEPVAFSDSLEKLEHKTEEEWRKNLADSAEGKNINMFIEDESGRLIGMLSGHVHSNRRLEHNAFLSALYVYPEFRGKGLGKLLIEKGIELIKKRCPQVINFHCEIVTTQRASIRIHEQLGFVKIGEIKNLFKIDDKFYSEYWMQKEM